MAWNALTACLRRSRWPPPDERKLRWRVDGIFPHEESIIRLIGAVLLEANDEWQLQHRYMQVEAMAELHAPAPDPLNLNLITATAAA